MAEDFGKINIMLNTSSSESGGEKQVRISAPASDYMEAESMEEELKDLE
ncbi:hypothetical protein ACFVAD_07755 [Sutcliffiella sp. NPDC057660]